MIGTLEILGMEETFLQGPLYIPFSQWPRRNVELDTFHRQAMPKIDQLGTTRKAKHDIGRIGIKEPIL